MWNLTAVTSALLAALSWTPLATELAVARQGEVQAPKIEPGAIEVGVGGLLTSVESTVSASISARGGTFVRLGRGLAGLEIESGFRHVQELDILDLQVAGSWQPSTGTGFDHLFVALAGGLRVEWLGSYRRVCYPAGLHLGLRVPWSARAALRTEYRVRRVFQDPGFTEHQIVVGLSVFFRNS